ncbi:PBP1A family penicillin-binding protein [candidate division WWE3 bacterium]|uniref:PBP1A family penicillin-binding protein n=1 Tax=candidate division WWE3 bacterium TaxID=2053526 RepID=A0A955RP26_UNCKA|nr:PBP1A family penicillin-binding protein [candidate division WWE3 bacterium]
MATSRRHIKTRYNRWKQRARQLTKRSKRQKRVRVLSIVATLGLLGVLLAAAGGVTAVVLFSKDLPSPDKLTEREIAQTTKIYSRQGDLLYEIFDDQQRTLIQLEDIPDNLKDATIAIEDADFYHHSGFDIRGILRSAFRVLTKGEIQGGGSTITQQVVKNVLLTPEQTYTRKLKELILALRLESAYEKDEILQIYFNEVAYGGNYYGAGAAAEGYFGKHVRDLTLEEAAFIAGLPQAPSVYSPRSGDPELAKLRYDLVLDQMVKNGYITEERAQEAKDYDVISTIVPIDNNIKAPHFVFYVKQELVKQFGEKLVEQGGLRVTTTLDMGKQVIAEEEIGFQLDRLAQQAANASNQALISVDPRTGEILAMVGSANYFDESIDGNVNVILARRQPGSAMKPIVYVKGFQMGYTPATFLPDILACFGRQADGSEYCPSNSDGKYWGPLLAREALANSRNTPAIRMAQLVGVENIITQAQELGITTLDQPDRYGLSIALGAAEVKPIELVRAYTAFANNGEQPDLVSILKVEDSSGKVIFENKPEDAKLKRVLPEEPAYLITDILSDNRVRQRLFGANNLLEIGRPAAVKTGTTNDNKDAWTCGYVPQLATCVWTGNTDNTPMAQTIQGSTGATPTFHYYMQRALDNEPVQQFTRPDSIKQVTVDALSGMLPLDDQDFPTRVEVFAKGTEPTEKDNFHQVVEVCKSKGLLATDYHRLIGDVENKTFIYLREQNPALQKYTDEWMSKNSGYGKPPEETCPIVDSKGKPLTGPYVEITSPTDGSEMDNNEFTVTVEAYSEHRIIKVEFYWDDTLVTTINSSPYEATYSVSKDVEGTHEIRVIAYDGKGEQSETTIEVEYPTVTPAPSSSPTPENGGGPVHITLPHFNN